MWRWIYNADYGALNGLLTQLGIIQKYIPWLTMPNVAMNLVIAADVWHSVPFIALILQAALATLPVDLDEAAKVDGATRTQRFLLVHLPLLRAAILVALIIRTVEAFRAFDVIYVITNGGPAFGTVTISFLTYLETFSYGHVGRGAALSFLISIFTILTAFLYIRFLYRPAEEQSTTLAFPGAPFNGEYSGNGDSSFFIPEFGYNKMISPKLSLGVSVYGNGGMNTKYTTLNAATGGGIFGQGDLGVDLSELFIAPTLGYKIDDRNSVGVSLILAYQRFKAYGLTNFAFPPPFNASLYPANVTNNGYDSTFGAGFRIGWIGQISPELSVGASYQSPIWMQRISKYKGLFANESEFDIPMNATVGLAWKVMPKANLAFDVQWVNHSGITSINNTMYTPCQLGTSCGPGFAWRDMTTFKLGGGGEVPHRETVSA